MLCSITAERTEDLFKNVTVRDAVWIADLMSQLSDQQIQDAFRARKLHAQSSEAFWLTLFANDLTSLRDLQPSIRDQSQSIVALGWHCSQYHNAVACCSGAHLVSRKSELTLATALLVSDL